MNRKFRCAEDALRFAFHYSGETYDRPMMNKMADDPVRRFVEAMGLSGNDGAAQSGMIWNQVMRLSDMSQYVLFASYSPMRSVCDCGRACCSGHKPNPFWDACIGKIEEAAITRALAGCISHRILRRQIVRRCFGDKSVVLSDVATICGVAQNTASNHHQAIRAWLFGTKPDGWTTGIRPRAVEQLNAMLIESGIVASAANVD